MTREALLTLGVLLTMIGSAFGQQVRCVIPRMDQVNAHVRSKVTKSASGLDYHYLVENGRGAPQFLIRFAVQVSTPSGPDLTQLSPVAWEGRGRIAGTTFYSWTTFSEPRGLAPGTSAMGFRLVNAPGLPAITRFLAWNDVEPPSFTEGQAPDSCEGDDLLENSFKGVTIGPAPPPQSFVPIEFLSYVITLLHDSRRLGWITVDGVHQSLLAKLLAAKRKLEAGEPGAAGNILHAFLNEVRAVSCPEFACPGNKPLTSEAYALLFFNGQFLRERLP